MTRSAGPPISPPSPSATTLPPYAAAASEKLSIAANASEGSASGISGPTRKRANPNITPHTTAIGRQVSVIRTPRRNIKEVGVDLMESVAGSSKMNAAPRAIDKPATRKAAERAPAGTCARRPVSPTINTAPATRSS